MVLVQHGHDATCLGLPAQSLQGLQRLLQLGGGDDVTPELMEIEDFMVWGDLELL